MCLSQVSHTKEVLGLHLWTAAPVGAVYLPTAPEGCCLLPCSFSFFYLFIYCSFVPLKALLSCDLSIQEDGELKVILVHTSSFETGLGYKRLCSNTPELAKKKKKKILFVGNTQQMCSMQCLIESPVFRPLSGSFTATPYSLG